jgi:hypothetical protein
MRATVASATLSGAVGQSVSVEVHVSNGLPGFTIVGLPDAAVRESRDRLRAALLSSGLPWPLRRVTVNLAPSRYRFGKPTAHSPSTCSEHRCRTGRDRGIAPASSVRSRFQGLLRAPGTREWRSRTFPMVPASATPRRGLLGHPGARSVSALTLGVVPRSRITQSATKARWTCGRRCVRERRPPGWRRPAPPER